VAAGVAVVALAVGATTSWVSVLNRVASAEESLTSGPLPDLAARIEDDRGIIGARVGRLLYVRRGIPVWGTVFLSEREFVTYLTWPSDAEVVRVLRRHDIGWALVSKDWRREVAYHDTWLRPAYGTTARHPEALFASPAFCLTDDVAGYVLYRLGPCRPGDVEGGS